MPRPNSSSRRPKLSFPTPSEVQATRTVPYLENNKGIQTSLAAEQMTPDQASDMENFFVNEVGRVQVRGGTLALGTAATDYVVKVDSYRRGDGKKYLIRWWLTKVQYYYAGVWTDFTGAFPTFTASSVVYASPWGPNSLMYAGSQSKVYILDLSAFTSTQVAASPACDGVTVIGNRAVVWSVGTNYTRAQWSVKDDYTDWSGLGSGYEDIVPGPQGAGDRLLGIFPVDDVDTLIIRTESVWLMTQTGNSDAPFQFRFLYQISVKTGRAVSRGQGGLYIAGTSDVYFATTGGLKPISTGIKLKYLQDITDLYSSGSSITPTAYDEFRKAFYLYIPRTDGATYSEVLVYSEQFDCWTTFKYPILLYDFCIHNAPLDANNTVTTYIRGPVFCTTEANGQVIYESAVTATDVIVGGSQNLSALMTLAALQAIQYNHRVKIEQILIDTDGGQNGSYKIAINLYTPSRYDSQTFETITYEASTTVVTNRLRTRKSFFGVYVRDGIVPSITLTACPMLVVIGIGISLSDGGPVQQQGSLYNVRVAVDLVPRESVDLVYRIVS